MTNSVIIKAVQGMSELAIIPQANILVRQSKSHL